VKVRIDYTFHCASFHFQDFFSLSAFAIFTHCSYAVDWVTWKAFELQNIYLVNLKCLFWGWWARPWCICHMDCKGETGLESKISCYRVVLKKENDCYVVLYCFPVNTLLGFYYYLVTIIFSGHCCFFGFSPESLSVLYTLCSEATND